MKWDPQHTYNSTLTTRNTTLHKKITIVEQQRSRPQQQAEGQKIEKTKKKLSQNHVNQAPQGQNFAVRHYK